MIPHIRKLGTIDCDLVETTPVVFKGRLYRFEYVRSRYAGNTTGDSYFRFVDHESGASGPSSITTRAGRYRVSRTATTLGTSWQTGNDWW